MEQSAEMIVSYEHGLRSSAECAIIRLIVEDKPPGTPIADEEERLQRGQRIRSACKLHKVSLKVILESDFRLIQAEILDPL